MTSSTYNNQVLTKYLLGALPEAETERLDELSFTNDEFAESLRAAENDLVDAYVKGELSGGDLQSFKSFYLDSHLRREKITFAQALHDWSERNVIARAVSVPPDNRPKRGWFFGLNIFSARLLAWEWSLAAIALILFVAVGVLLIQNLRFRQQMKQTQVKRDELLQREQELRNEIETQRSATTQAEQELARLRNEREHLEQELKTRGYQPREEGKVVSLILAPPMRGGGQIPAATIRPDTNLVAVQLELGAADYPRYRVVLIDPANNKTLWRSSNLKARTRPNGRNVGVSLPATLLKPQNYILRVSGLPMAGSTEIVSDYPFRVVK